MAKFRRVCVPRIQQLLKSALIRVSDTQISAFPSLLRILMGPFQKIEKVISIFLLVIFWVATSTHPFFGVMFYGAEVWDPWMIVARIVCLQCLYYLTLGLFLAILVGTRVSRMSLVYFFDFATVSASTITGWCVIASFFLSSLVGTGYLLYLVQRAKKCLDFSATLYIVHLFICIIYGGWPSSLTWWVVNITGLAVMALLGEYLCIRRELREIPITRFRSSV